ncbi:MAG: TlpA family protein disulfide reductase [Acidobacteria bacterium]|nr:MAG: TlpA family protein disulfide reductase [Acidobacteriota bacterium]
MRRSTSVLAFALAAVLGLTPAGDGQRPGIRGQRAPAWQVDAWFNLPAGRDRLDVSDFRGKVLYVFCFQSWCPGCHSHGFPTLQAVYDRFKDDEGVAFVAVQTVFEGFASNSASDGARTMAEYELPIPWAQAEGEHRRPPPFMVDYRTGGTPWTILIDPEGTVRFDGFGIEPDQAIAVIEKLKRRE